jgi:hypothetical protein
LKDKKDEDKEKKTKEIDSNILKASESLQGQFIVSTAGHTAADNITIYWTGSRKVMNKAVQVYKRGLKERLEKYYNDQNKNNGNKLSPAEIDKLIIADLTTHPFNARHVTTIKSRETIGKLYADDSRAKCQPEDIKEEILKSELVDIECLTNDAIAMIPDKDFPLMPKPNIATVRKDRRVKKALERFNKDDGEGR